MNEWQDRWQEGRIGFHLPEYNKQLLKYWPELEVKENSSVFVPLCGKTLDLVWLRQQGNKVTGSELIEMAVKAFFNEQGFDPEVKQQGELSYWSYSGLSLIQGDFFAIPDYSIDASVFYDRAALIALPESMRKQYVEKLLQAAPAIEKGLLITVEYEQSQMSGPPFSVSESEVRSLYSNRFDIKLLARERTDLSPKMKAAGLTGMSEVVYQLVRK
ncbi:thiopurine S-methyltransferase [Endozoicomonas sp. OPT23]|uniref:thiopurine S-methyltransferase n=1 Tax=Endozoicomonas sp. OPT23 TaxID=2072845 RepID=UPI00129B54F0|nr:thiopurine S-methyltransferase [Endozoicomonas sp. OPT23]MRI31534.1 thiopurine S-methyltransferase [Endozoicomonas sp. OPT23]